MSEGKQELTSQFDHHSDSESLFLPETKGIRGSRSPGLLEPFTILYLPTYTCDLWWWRGGVSSAAEGEHSEGGFRERCRDNLCIDVCVSPTKGSRDREGRMGVKSVTWRLHGFHELFANKTCNQPDQPVSLLFCVRDSRGKS